MCVCVCACAEKVSTDACHSINAQRTHTHSLTHTITVNPDVASAPVGLQNQRGEATPGPSVRYAFPYYTAVTLENRHHRPHCNSPEEGHMPQ